MLDEYGFPFIEGGWPGSNPKDIEFFAAARKERWQHGEAGRLRVTRHRANRPEDDPNLRELVAAETPVVTIFGKSWLLHVTEVLGATPAENLDMVADSVALRRRSGPRGRVRRRALLRRLPRGPRLRPGDAPRRTPGRRADPRPVRHQRRHADGRAGRDRRRRPDVARGRPGRARRDLGHPHPQRRRARGRELDRRGPGRASATSRRTINGYGERCGNANMVSILANLALKTPESARCRRAAATSPR